MKNCDNQYLDQLRDYYAENGVMPSFAGIASLVGLNTTSAVSVMVGRLKESGFLVSTPDKRLAPGPRFYERPEVAEAVRAGMPEYIRDVANDPVLIDRLLVEEPSRTVIVPIQGDSMMNAGLLEGDRVVVKRGAPAKPGDVVVAIVDGEFTVKYLASDERGYYLKPGNPDFDDIRPQNELELFGRVTGSFRVY
jgi:repressor LexA